jgi:hypothetical protein
MRPVPFVQGEVPQRQVAGLAEVPSMVVQTGAAMQMQYLESPEHDCGEVDKVLK